MEHITLHQGSIGKTIIKGGTYDGKRFPRTVLKFSKEQGFHTTQKPVPLLEWLIKTYTDEGDRSVISNILLYTLLN